MEVYTKHISSIITSLSISYFYFYTSISASESILVYSHLYNRYLYYRYYNFQRSLIKYYSLIELAPISTPWYLPLLSTFSCLYLYRLICV